MAGRSGGAGEFRVVPQTGDGLVILTNFTSGYIPIERILCVWESRLTGKEGRCPTPTSYALLGAYSRGGVAGALAYYDALVDRADPDYLVDVTALSEFARLLLGAGRKDEAITVYRYMVRSGVSGGAVFGEVADRLATGFELPEDRLHAYLGEYRSSSGETVHLERAGDGVAVRIVAGPGGSEGITASLRPLSERVWVFDLGGYLGEVVFDLAESGAATGATVREMAFGITLTAERLGDTGCHRSQTVSTRTTVKVAGQLPAPAGRRFRLWSALSACRPPADVVQAMKALVRAAHEAGVPVLPGTDFVAGFGLHAELVEYVRAGIPAPEVLRLATLGAARVMGLKHELGSIAPGKLADLILVDGDPTVNIEDIRRVVLVVKDGRVYDPAEIHRALGTRAVSGENSERQ